jgi:hypothetical protein
LIAPRKGSESGQERRWMGPPTLHSAAFTDLMLTSRLGVPDGCDIVFTV